MKKLLLIVLFCLFSFNIFCETTNYLNNKYNFSMSIPAGWLISEPGIENNNGLSVKFAFRAKKDTDAINVSVDDWYNDRLNEKQRETTHRSELDLFWSDENNIKQFADPSLKALSSLKDYYLYEQDIRPFDETKALYFRYSASLPIGLDTTVPMMVTAYMIMKNGILFTISASSVKDYYEKTKSQIQQAINSFHVVTKSQAVIKSSLTTNSRNLWKDIIIPILIKAAPQAIFGTVIVIIIISVAFLRLRHKHKKQTTNKVLLDSSDESNGEVHK